jgi:hypothetical protein
MPMQWQCANLFALMLTGLLVGSARAAGDWIFKPEHRMILWATRTYGAGGPSMIPEK